MKKENKKTNLKRSEKITTAVLACLLIGGVAAIGGKVYHDSTKKEPGVIETIPGDEDVSIKQNGITIKKLNSVTNQDGSVTKTFTYTISPVNATNKAISASAKYADGTACTDVVTVSTNTSNQTISITCKKDFGKVINVTITSLANSSATATIKLNYTKKLKSITGLTKTITFENNSSTHTANLADYYTPVYSAYTKDATYRFEINKNDSADPFWCEWGDGIDDSKKILSTKLAAKIEEAIANNTALPNASDIWNLDSSNAYHSWLIDMTKNNTSFLEMNCYFTVKNVEDPTKKASCEVDIRYNIGAFDYLSKTVGVDSLAAELTTIDF